MNRKILITCILMQFGHFYVSAGQNQDTVRFKKNVVFIELMGNGIYSSLNYERQISITNSFILSGRIGASMDHIGSYYFPVLANMIAGKKGHNFELGIGANVDITHYSDISKWSAVLHPTMNIGYRYQKPEGRLVFRADFTPVVFQGSSQFTSEESQRLYNPFFIWFGISAGWKF